jgi:hypothetical protein
MRLIVDTDNSLNAFSGWIIRNNATAKEIKEAALQIEKAAKDPKRVFREYDDKYSAGLDVVYVEQDVFDMILMPGDPSKFRDTKKTIPKGWRACSPPDIFIKLFEDEEVPEGELASAVSDRAAVALRRKLEKALREAGAPSEIIERLLGD